MIDQKLIEFTDWLTATAKSCTANAEDATTDEVAHCEEMFYRGQAVGLQLANARFTELVANRAVVELPEPADESEGFGWNGDIADHGTYVGAGEFADGMVYDSTDASLTPAEARTVAAWYLAAADAADAAR